MILTSVLLPAPFSPRRAWISPGLICRSTLSLARQPGKLLTIPLRSRSEPASSAPLIRKVPFVSRRSSPPVLSSPVLASVRNFVRFVGPFLEDRPAFLHRQLDDRQLAILHRAGKFAVDW